MTATFTNPGELAVQRSITAGFIAAAPNSIALTPQTKTKQASGGERFVPGIIRPAQIFKLIAQTDVVKNTRSDDGFVTERTYDYVLLGAWNAVIAENDFWVDGNTRYTIEAVGVYNGYEVRGFVRARG